MRDPTPPQTALHPTNTAKTMNTKTPRKHTRMGSMRVLLLPPTPPVRSRSAATIVRWFGLREAIEHRARAAHGSPPAPAQSPIALDLAPGTVTLVTGPSGAGKSSLLRDAQRVVDVPAAHPITWIDLASVALPDVPIIDCFDRENHRDEPDRALRETLLTLARVGLAEAWTYLRTPAELSDGQRWRLRLALAFDRARRVTDANPNACVVLIADEFAALLDRVTACVVARSLRRMIAPNARVAALVATSHRDLSRALSPDVLVSCDFGRITTRTAPTIAHGFAARGFADHGAQETKARPRSAPTDPRSRKRKASNLGGPVRKIIVGSLATLALIPIVPAHGADNEPRTRSTIVDPRGGNDRLLLAPPSPFEPQRSLFQLDARSPRREGSPLYPSVERELDRGAGRTESDAEFDIRRYQREQDARRGVVTPQREFERFDEDRDRTLRIETAERRAELDRRAQQRLETESQRLAADRERFYRSAEIDATGAAHDTGELRRIEHVYQRDVKQLRRERAAELNRLEKQRDLKGDALRSARTEIDERYRAAQTERRERYATERARVMGSE